MRASSMRGRMTAAFALSLTVLMALVSGGLIWYARYVEERNADAILRLNANTVRQEAGDKASLRDPVRFLRQEGDELRAAGLVVFTTTTSAPAASLADRTSLTSLRTIRVDIGSATRIIGVPWRPTEDSLRVQAGALIGLSIFSIVVGTLGAWFVVGKTLSPIERLSQEVDRVPIEALHVHLTAPSTDAEILHLVGTLNGLLDRLSQAAALHSRFYSAASHELRTPLHTLSGHLEVGLSRPRTNPEYRATLEEAYRQTARLSSIVQDLLLLTRLNTTQVPPAKETIDLAELCDRTLAQFAAAIDDHRLSIVMSCFQRAQIVAPPNYAGMVVRNLLENAVRYTGEGGTITVALELVHEGVRLEIRNDCPQLLDADIDLLLDPFYRPDGSRQSGTGLGLAICSAIARANCWALKLSADPQFFRVTVTFPQPAAVD